MYHSAHWLDHTYMWSCLLTQGNISALWGICKVQLEGNPVIIDGNGSCVITSTKLKYNTCGVYISMYLYMSFTSARCRALPCPTLPEPQYIICLLRYFSETCVIQTADWENRIVQFEQRNNIHSLDLLIGDVYQLDIHVWDGTCGFNPTNNNSKHLPIYSL